MIECISNIEGIIMKAINLAYYIINRCIENGNYISNLQLQKILYFVNLLYLSDNKVFLLEKNENFEAWQHGPVIPEIYREFSINGGMKIYNKKDILDASLKDENGNEIKEDKIVFIDKTIDYLSKIDPWKLVEYSHSSTGAWYHTYHDGKTVINKELLQKEAGV